MIQADYNNDGCMDILVLRGGWEFPRRLSLLRNNRDGTFTDVTAQSGLGRTPTSTQSAVWTDIDNDGNLDLFIANENSPSQLFLNKGDGTFIDISRAAGVDRTAFSKAAVAADCDNDGYPDIFVSNFAGQNFLYHNNRDRTFSEAAEQAHVQEPFRSFGAAFLDYDNDGLPDLFVTSYYTSTDEFARGFAGLKNNAESMKLYKNRGDGTFSDVSAQVGLDRVLMPMGCNFGDVDNDGFLDIYLGNGSPTYTARAPNILLRNDGGKTFVDVTTSSGTGATEKGHAIAFADFTNSGHEDIAVVTMSYRVTSSASLDGLKPGTTIQFTLTVDNDQTSVSEIRTLTFDSVDREPLQARSLAVMEDALGGKARAIEPIQPGQTMPDFSFMDQTRRIVSLAGFSGKVVAVTFVYTRCPLPDYCFRLSNNFGRLQNRFQNRMGTDLVLLSITFDPAQDSPEVLAKYGQIWKADPRGWHLLTGSLDEVQRVCNLFGTNFWPDEGVLTHSLHTFVIDRQGKLVANIEGNRFTAEQLGDLVQTFLNAGGHQ